MAGRASRAGLVSYDPRTRTYRLTDEAALALADENSPVFTARAMNAFGSFYADIDKLTSAFRGNGAVSWGDHDARLFQGTEWLFRTGYRAYLPEWIASLDGVQERLETGAWVADVGCGHGASVIAMAELFPNSRFWGIDSHQASIDTARSGQRRPA